MIQTLYNRLVREQLPQKWKVTGDIAVKSGRLLDTTDEIDMEKTLRMGIREVVTPGDSVLIIGGGYGTSTVEASRLTGENGSVHTIEPVAENLNRIDETIRHNYTHDNIRVTNGYVSHVTDESIDQFGEPEGMCIDPSELDRYDVIVIDCEGAETEIVPALDYRDMVLESHEWTDSPNSYLMMKENTVTYLGDEGPHSSIWLVQSKE